MIDENKISDEPARQIRAVVAAFDGRLRRYLARGVKPEDIDDTIQEIYARLSRQAMSPTPPAFNATYVFRTADSVLCDMFRRRRTRGSDSIELPETLAADQPSPFDELLWRQNADRLRQAIAKLPPAERKVLLQSRIEGLSLNDIALKNRTPMRTVQRHLSQALAQCRDSLKECGWFET